MERPWKHFLWGGRETENSLRLFLNRRGTLVTHVAEAWPSGSLCHTEHGLNDTAQHPRHTSTATISHNTGEGNRVRKKQTVSYSRGMPATHINSQMAEQLGNRATNQKVTSSIPGRAK